MRLRKFYEHKYSNKFAYLLDNISSNPLLPSFVPFHANSCGLCGIESV